MPILNLKDKFGTFFRYGLTGKKYYYNPANSFSAFKARDKAIRQGQAIAINRYKKYQESL